MTAADTEALEAFVLLSRLEGIVPALESAHTLAYALRLASTMRPHQFIIVNLSGRGDKDVDEVTRLLDIREDVAVATGGCSM